MWNNLKGILLQYLSVDESKKSIVIIVLIALTTVGIYKCYLGNDVPPNVINAIINICGMIFGINIGNTVSSMYSSYISKKVFDNNPLPIQNEISQDSDSHVSGSF